MKHCFYYLEDEIPDQGTGRCLLLHDSKMMCLLCEDCIATGKCPQHYVSPYLGEK